MIISGDLGLQEADITHPLIHILHSLKRRGSPRPSSLASYNAYRPTGHHGLSGGSVAVSANETATTKSYLLFTYWTLPLPHRGTASPYDRMYLFKAEFIADGQHTTVAIPLYPIAVLAEIGHSGSSANVERDAVLELIREANRK